MTGLVVNDLHKAFGSHVILAGLNMDVPAGSFTAILGASGSGKTTLLRLLAGFEQPDRGTITIGERVVHTAGRHIRPELRRIGYVPQEGSLFPHLTVEANVSFGLRRKQRKQRTDELLEFVGLSKLNRRYPHQLSGGQQQRVALARALAIEPDVVLLDEPFASLDAHLRSQVREDVREILRRSGTTAILVTHDQEEALSLADLIAVLRNGTIAQHATPHDVYTMPADDDIATFIGHANMLPGRLDGAMVETALGTLPVSSHGERPASASLVTALVRPEQVEVEPEVGSDGVYGRITRAGYHGHDTILHIETSIDGAPRQLIARAPSDKRLVPGTGVRIRIHGPALIWPRGAHPGCPTTVETQVPDLSADGLAERSCEV